MSLNTLELNAEIERVEAGIVQREARLRGRVAELGRRVDAALPKVAAAGVVAGALGLLVLWLRPRRLLSAAAAAPLGAGSAPGGLWHWVSLAWPMLPLSLRAMVDLRLVTAIGKPLLALFKRRQVQPTSPPRQQGQQQGQQQRPPSDARKKRG